MGLDLENIMFGERGQAQRPHMAQVHSHEASRIGKFTDTASKAEITTGWRRGAEAFLPSALQTLFGRVKKVWKSAVVIVAYLNVLDATELYTSKCLKRSYDGIRVLPQ